MLHYTFFELIGIIVAGFVVWQLKMPKIENKHKQDIYICGIIGMLLGMKLPVLISYGLSSDFILHGKSYMGGVLGAFFGINLYKLLTHQTQSSFGGRFVIPLTIAVGFGKIGCYFNGCCSGHFIIPIQLLESGFQFLMAGILYLFYKKTNRIDLLFPIYLLSYLIMRFIIEFIRIEPRLIGPFTIYHVLALIFIPVLIIILWRRRHA
ncbi:MAG: prolipoprotein diacylglyceryl transferase [Alphaproteobacteria bacterium]|nr:prolipoprotein diacylglyceryl transferase [Alphaproteobacteria bacterium]